MQSEKIETSGPTEKAEANVVPLLPSEPASSGPDEEARPKESHLVFAYLRKERPLPSPLRTRWIVVSLYMIMTLAGWDTGASAPLLPFLQAYYKINFLIMSMIYVTTFAGGLIAAGLNVYITDRLGFGLVSSLGTVCFALGYVISSSGGPYPLFALSFVLNGIGFGFQDAQINAITARLPNPNAKMSLLHAFFGLGGTVAPFISTPFVQHFPTRPYLLYTINLAVALITLGIEVAVFKGMTEEQLTGRKDEIQNEIATAAAPLGELGTDVQAATVQHEAEDGGVATPATLVSSAQKMKRILSNPAVYVFTFHAFLYVGVETTIGGWAPTYLINVRGADSNAGYVTSGFWGALTVGRVFLIPVTSKLGNRWSVFVYSALSAGLQLVTWLVPNYICSAVCICFTGFFLAPIFPCAVVMITELIPDELHVGVIGLFGTIGGAGAAAMPFILGAMSDRFGFWVMGPFMFAGLAGSIILWAFVPRHKQK